MPKLDPKHVFFEFAPQVASVDTGSAEAAGALEDEAGDTEDDLDKPEEDVTLVEEDVSFAEEDEVFTEEDEAFTEDDVILAEEEDVILAEEEDVILGEEDVEAIDDVLLALGPVLYQFATGSPRHSPTVTAFHPFFTIASSMNCVRL